MAIRQEMVLHRDMQRVVDALHAQETSVTPYADEYRTLLDTHGKMIRAMLVVLFARATPVPGQRNDTTQLPSQSDHADLRGGQLDQRVITGAAAIEMLHLATLVHDDVLDNAPIRRNQPTAHTIVGNKAAIYLGDLILSRYMEIMATIAPTTDFVREQSATVCEIVGGELLQESARHHTQTSIAYYNRAIGGKTAALFRLSCLTGIRLSQPEPDSKLLEAARTFGDDLGMAFQIIDDLEDFNIEHDTGKPKLEDVRDGIYTLPVLLGIEADSRFAADLEHSEPQDVLLYLRAHPELIEHSKAIVKEHLDAADQALTMMHMDAGIHKVLSDLLSKLLEQI